MNSSTSVDTSLLKSGMNSEAYVPSTTIVNLATQNVNKWTATSMQQTPPCTTSTINAIKQKTAPMINKMILAISTLDAKIMQVS
jgi:hypothetical protein